MQTVMLANLGLPIASAAGVPLAQRPTNARVVFVMPAIVSGR